MTKDEALRLALEALESMAGTILELGEQTTFNEDQAGRAGKEALAQPAQGPINYADWIYNPMTGAKIWDDEQQQERESLRVAQSEAVMPLIEPLLDAWEGGSDFLNEYPALDEQLRRIYRAMGHCPPAAALVQEDAYVSVPRGLLGAACAAINHGWNKPNILEQLRRYTVGDLSTPPLAQPAQGQPLTNMQPLVNSDGVIRFKSNAIVQHLLDKHPACDMNALACIDFTDEDRMQFAQLIGYSLSGYSDLSYVSDESYEAAEKAAHNIGAKLKEKNT